MLKESIVSCTAVVVLFSAGSPLRAAIMRSDVLESEYRDFGADPRFQSVSAVGIKPAYDGHLRSDGWNGGGSGVLIDPNWVLTAGHVKYTDDGQIRGNEFAFFIGSSFYDTARVIEADAFITYPGYYGGWGGSTIDLALMHLSEPVMDITPATRSHGAEQVDSLVYGVGYGTPGFSYGWFDVGGYLLEYDGIKRAGSNLIDSFGSLRDGSQYIITSFQYGYDVQHLEWQGSPGDSGGGLFSEIGGEMQLVGINDFGYFPYGQFGQTGSLRVSLFNDWIDGVMASYDTPEVVPEPSMFLVFTLGSVIILPILRRLRSKRG
jgi:hypothetical protein